MVSPHPSRPRPEAGRREACGLRCGGDGGAAVPAAFLPLSRRFPEFCLRLLRQKRAKRPNRRKKIVFPSIRAYFASIHTQFGLLRRLRGSGGRPCGLSPPRAPPCRLLLRRAAPRACGVVAVEGVSCRPTNKGRRAPSPDRVCRAFQRPAAPSPRHDITRPTQQNVQLFCCVWKESCKAHEKWPGAIRPFRIPDSSAPFPCFYTDS